MKKIILQFLVSVLILTPALLRSQSNITLDAGTNLDIQSSANVCADTRTINGTITGAGTWCIIPLTPVPPVPVSPANNVIGQNIALTFLWQRSLGAVTYRFQLATDSLFSSLIVNDSTIADSTRAVSGLTPLTYYWWRVNAKGIGGTSVFSIVYKFKTLGPPFPVTLLNPPNNAVNQPISEVFTWSRTTDQTQPSLQSFAKISTQPTAQPLTVGKVTGKPNDVVKSGDGIDAISSYWFDMVTDTVSLANLVRDTTLTDTTKSLGGLNNLTSYYWRVRAKNQIGWGSYSVWFKLTTIMSAPVAPILVSPLNNAVGQNLSLTLVWNKSSTAATYRVQVATDSLFSGLIVNDSTVTDSTRAISGLNPLRYYWWRVNAKNLGGTSAFSTIYKFKTLGSPSQITLLIPTNNAVNQPTSLNFVWSRATDQTLPLFAQPLIKQSVQTVTKTLVRKNVLGKQSDGIDAVSNYWFDLVTDTVSLANLVRDTTLTDTTKSLSGLNNLTSYYWRVRAKNQVGWGSYSVWFKLTTIISAPLAPLLVIPANNAIGQNLSLTLVWNKSSTAATYRVQVATDSLFSGLIVNDSTITDSTRVISGLNPLTYYWWRVNAKNLGGTSTYSSVWKFKTLGSPFQVNLISPPNNAVNQPTSLVFTWNRATEQTSPLEAVKLSGNSGDGFDAVGNYWFDLVTDTVTLANLVRDTTLVDTTKSLSGLNNLTSFYWRVKAKNQIGWGNYSVWFKFTTIVIVPPIPVQVSPPNNSTGQPVSLNLVWHHSLSAVSYRVELSTDSLFGSFIVNDSTITDTIRTVSGLSYLTKYYWRVNAKNIAGTSSFSSTWNFMTIPLPPAIVNLNVIPGGFYSSGQLNLRDTIWVVLVDSTSCTLMDSAKVLLDSVSFSTNLSYSVVPTGRYYIYVYHRNHLTISSRFTQNVIRGSNVSYDFTTDSAKTYGFNVIKVSTSPVRWGMIPGDANQDGYVDGLDQSIWAVQNGANGYFPADFNGDTYVDGLDQSIWVNSNGQSSSLPCYFSFVSQPGKQNGQPTRVIFNRGDGNNNVHKVIQNSQKNNK